MENGKLAAKSPIPTALAELGAVLLETPKQRARADRLLNKFHYLKSLKPVGERLYYALVDARGDWLGVAIFSAAARRLRGRESWIGWTEEQRRRRLPLVANNCRLLFLPHKTHPNMGSRSLRLLLDRLSEDWRQKYGHPILIVETFVDPEQFSGTVYSANGWEELGLTDGSGRVQRDFYERHDRPKRLFARELVPGARRSLQAEHLKPSLAAVEAQTPARCTLAPKAIASLAGQFKAMPDYRRHFESYPLWSLLTIMLLAHLCGAPKGQKDLAGFALRLSAAQRRSLGVRRNRQGQYPAPSQPTFHRVMKHIDALALENVFLSFQTQIRGPAPPDELIVMDGKEPTSGSGDSILTAVSVPSQYYLGSALVDQKTNEIPVAREFFERLDLDGRRVSLDALHTQTETAQALVLEAGGDYLFTVKANQPKLQERITALVTPLPGRFSP